MSQGRLNSSTTRQVSAVIRTGWRGKNEKEREELGLTTQATLSDAELASVDNAMLTEEKRAYSRRPQVFGPTAHMEKA